MFEMKSKTAKMTPKFVLLVPCFVVLAACSSKQIQNASTEPLDIPAESNYTTPDSEYTAPVAPARVEKIRKKGGKSRKAKSARHVQPKKSLKPTLPTAVAQTQSQNQAPEVLPVIGDESMATAPIAIAPMAPPVPFGMDMHGEDGQPNWFLTALIIAGVVGLAGVAFRVRKQTASRKRRLVFNS